MAIDFENLEEGQLEVVETLAREAGWVPEGEWKGKKEDHRPATEYLRNSKKVISNQKVTMRNLEKQLTSLNRKFDTAERRHQQETIREIDDIRAQLKTQMRDAVAAGDQDKYDKVEKQLDTLEEKHREIAAATETTGDILDPLFLGWLETNGDWYEHNAEMTAKADDFLGTLTEDLPFAQKLASVDTYMRGAYPKHFNERGQDNKTDDASVSDAEPSGGGGGGGSSKLTYESLPGSGKVACDSFVSQKLGTRDEFLKQMQDQADQAEMIEY